MAQSNVNPSMLAKLHSMLAEEYTPFQTRFIKGLFHTVPEDYFLQKLQKLLRKEEVYCSRLASFIKELMSTYYYNKPFLLKLYNIAEQTLKGSIDDLNEVKLQLIKSVHFKKTLEKIKFDLDSKPAKMQFFLLKWKPKEVAEQLSIFDERLFHQLRIIEFKDGNWLKKDKNIKSPNLTTLANFFNRISLQIVAECLHGDIKERAKTLSFFIHVGKELQKIHNYDMLMAVMGALNNSPVQRLKKTWQIVPNDDLLIYDELDELTSHIGNYKTYRSMLESLRARREAYLPILSVVLRDITFTDQGNENFINSKPNFEKIELVGDILENTILNFQKLYNFPKNPLFEQEILSCPLTDEEELIRMSFQKEPPTNQRAFSDFVNLNDNDVTLPDDNTEKETLSLSTSNSSEEKSDPNLSIGDNIIEKATKDDSIESIQSLTISEKRNILRNMRERDPRSWSKVELFVILESWEIPEDRCLQLSEKIILNSTSLMNLDNKLLGEYGIKEVGLRIKIKKQVDSFKDFYVLMSTYGQNAAQGTNGSMSISFDKKPILHWTLLDIRDWLEGLECGGYGDLFEAENITGKELRDMEEGDLLRIGIKPLGHRKKILRSLLLYSKRKLSSVSSSPSQNHRLDKRQSSHQ